MRPIGPTICPVKISVIVPAFNEEKLLAESLRTMTAAMASFHKLGWETELIVCNNNSTDRTAEIAAKAGAKVVFEPVNQIGRARNCGAAAATGDWFVFVDADSQPSPGLFADVAAVIEKKKVIGGGSTVRLDGFHPFMNFGGMLWNQLSRIKKWAAGSFIYCEASAFREIGGFSNHLFVAEELDLSERLKALAKKRGLKMKILSQHPLITSARKVKLYSAREWLGFFFRAALSPRKTQRDPALCGQWYDGRR
ncbi:MAG: glycosyl transferase family 2 [Verrucomicrobiales bacterium]|nr:glycosyl transferase family 2 [Verrucomicrobiales bacterium]